MPCQRQHSSTLHPRLQSICRRRRFGVGPLLVLMASDAHRRRAYFTALVIEINSLLLHTRIYLVYNGPHG